MGVLIQKALSKVEPVSLRYFLTALLALISHGFLDRLARFTYHPPTPLFEDPFWIAYHLIIVFISVFIVIRYWKTYKIGMGFSILLDLDWVSMYVSGLFFQTNFWSRPILHDLFNFLDFLPPFESFNSLPDLSLKWEGSILEFGLLLMIVFLVRVTGRNMKSS